MTTQKEFNENDIVIASETKQSYEAQEKEKLREKKFIKPDLSEVKMYFAEKDAPAEEAEKFFNHYESNGWLVGGKSKMKNWQAAARNWLLNSKKFNNVIASTAKQSPAQNSLKANHLTATTNKSYQEKL
ncbi:hypothetical protein [Riemerella anatipestifer]|nr:hypothetical protein [Riemerella anatipestifer]MBT0549876.1 hypothetical protein [Riemerella anatipestifer]MBT0556535.1 hypothetical protein [Riemerella anatipestifer]MBT0560586.1 hypothetical protein [Riemerella anatipestifer]UZX27778.1 hypothetical protein OIS45_10505 [Riemerella anatipestifer]